MSVWRDLRAWTFARAAPPVARVAVNLRPRSSPYGGGNQFVELLARQLRFQGYDVQFHLSDEVDAVLLIDARRELTTFGADEIAGLRRRRPPLICVHRVNECDKRKASGFMDELLARANAVADHTVFISEWLRDYHAERWFDRTRPHSVIHNGADPRVFHPLGALAARPPFRLVTHHWSDHPMKGFAVYQEIDRLIAEGRLADTELWVIGRWPADVRWRTARLVPPRRGAALAELLRQCHAYVTASLWEPGGMHFIEGAQCGLPVAYHEDGGGIVEVARRFGVGYRDSVAEAVTDLRTRWRELRLRVLEHAPSGERMGLEYRTLFERLLAGRGLS